MTDNKNSEVGLRKRKKSLLKISLIVIACIIIFFCIILLKSYINTDKNYYNSLDEIVEKYYPGESYIYLEAAPYFYIVVDSDDVSREELVYKTIDGKYVIFNNWVEEVKNTKRFYESKDIREKDFYSFIHVDKHNCHYIILFERYYLDDVRPEIMVYDNNEEWEVVKTNSREYYFQVIDESMVNNNYELRMNIGEDSYCIIYAEEFEKVK